MALELVRKDVLLIGGGKGVFEGVRKEYKCVRNGYECVRKGLDV